jgi:arylsulfatase A-like enzyme
MRLRITDALKIALVLFGIASGIICAADKPNIVLIDADDLGYGDVGCYGATNLQTPNIDRLAKEGRRFTDAHTASAVCSPSRYGLMTGQFPLRRNFWGPLPFTNELTIDTSQPTIASVLKSAGYATAIIGKWHLGFGKGRNDWNVRAQTNSPTIFTTTIAPFDNNTNLNYEQEIERIC